ncbi:MAG: hypothetical protein K2X27_26885 [Candidatus Obscuribacterales bacterium]|nr:hypothetical protein [Candidatus Obscuribacterales bacterium]
MSSVAQSNNSSLLFGLLIFVQFLLVCFLIWLVNTPWYCRSFYSRMRELYAADFKAGPLKEPLLLRKALKYSELSQSTRFPNLDLIEESIFLSSYKSKSTLSALQRLKHASAEASASPCYRSVAEQKLLRQELRLCRFAIKNNDTDFAEKLLNDLRLRLQKGNALFSASRLSLIKQYLGNLAELKLLQSESDAASRLESAIERLHDPEFARAWYKQNGFKTFEQDFPQDYIAEYNMQHLSSVPDRQQQLLALTRAVNACASESVLDSKRLPILFDAYVQASLLNDKKLKELIFSVWSKTSALKKPSTVDQAKLIVGLIGFVGQSPEQARSILLLERYLDCMDSGLVDPKTQDFFIEDLKQQLDQIQLRVDKVSDCEKILRIAKRVEFLCAANKMDSSGALAEEALCFARLGNFESAETALLASLSKASSFHRNKNSEANMLALSRAVLSYLQASAQIDREQALLNLIVANKEWSAENRVKFMLDAAEIYHKKNDDKKWRKICEELASMEQKADFSRETRDDVREYLLRSYIWQEKTLAAEQLYLKFLDQSKSKPAQFEELTRMELSWFRARPSYNAEYKRMALKGEFPDRICYDALDFSEKYQRDPEKRAFIYLWAAQYEFCKDNKKTCIELCDKALKGQSFETAASFLPALYLKAVAEGKNPELPSDRIKCKAGTKSEMECEWSMLYTAGCKKASDKLRLMIPRVDEI